MKIFVDPRKTMWKGYVGPDYYLKKGCNRIAYFDQWFPSQKIDLDKKIIASNDYEFVDDPTKADVVLLPSEQQNIAEFFLNYESVDDICLKTETTKEIKLDDPYIDRYNPLLFMFSSVIETIEIGDNIEKIADYPNAFCNCKNLKCFKSTLIHEHYMAEPYVPGFNREETCLIEIDRSAENPRILHTFPPKPRYRKDYERCRIAIGKIYGDAFVGPLELDFLELDRVENWECIPGPEVVGQRVIFICESQELVNMLIRRRIKAVHVNVFRRYCDLYGDYDGRKFIKNYFDKEFENAGAYLPNVYR